MKPAWLEGLMSETFFATCELHQSRRKNEKNIFCLICCQSFCQHCLPSHHSHPLLQVRRYVYQDVVRLDELEKVIDCSYIQPYTINSAKVIFLHQRAQSRSYKGPVNTCLTCDRILQEPFHLCSLSCKVEHMIYEGEDLSSIIYKLDEPNYVSQFQGLQMDGEDDDQITPNSILEDPLQFQGSSCSSHGRGTSGFSHQIMLSLGNNNNNNNNNNNRRKGAPQRSPLS